MIISYVGYVLKKDTLSTSNKWTQEIIILSPIASANNNSIRLNAVNFILLVIRMPHRPRLLCPDIHFQLVHVNFPFKNVEKVRY